MHHIPRICARHHDPVSRGPTRASCFLPRNYADLLRRGDARPLPLSDATPPDPENFRILAGIVTSFTEPARALGQCGVIERQTKGHFTPCSKDPYHDPAPLSAQTRHNTCPRRNASATDPALGHGPRSGVPPRSGPGGCDGHTFLIPPPLRPVHPIPQPSRTGR